jgi:hypothetical protein
VLVSRAGFAVSAKPGQTFGPWQFTGGQSPNVQHNAFVGSLEAEPIEAQKDHGHQKPTALVAVSKEMGPNNGFGIGGCQLRNGLQFAKPPALLWARLGGPSNLQINLTGWCSKSRSLPGDPVAQPSPGPCYRDFGGPERQHLPAEGGQPHPFGEALAVDFAPQHPQLDQPDEMVFAAPRT